MPLDLTPLVFPLYGVLTALFALSAAAIAVAAVRLHRGARRSSARRTSPAPERRVRPPRVRRAA